MQKQVNFFEQNVQWFALGLGGLFLLWTVLSYVLREPVKETIPGRGELGPSEIDPVTLSGPVQQLKQEIANPTLPSIPQKDYVQSFVAAIKGADQYPMLAGNQINSIHTDPGIVGNDTFASPETGRPIDKLPILPAARPGAHTEGRSQVSWINPNWVPPAHRPNEQPP